MTDDPKKTVLVIEDDDNILELNRVYLERSGFHVLVAHDGQQGIALIKEKMPDVILCDLMLPELDGYAVLKEVRSDDQTALIPFIVMTANPDPRARRTGMRMGADDYINKPFHHNDVIIAINTQLMKRQRIQAAQQAQKAELQRTQRMFSMTMAHELRTPLSAIEMAKDLMLMQLSGQQPAGDTRELLGAMDRGTRRLRHMVEQMVLLTQLEMNILQTAMIDRDGIPMQFHLLVEKAIGLARDFDYRRQATQIELDPQQGDDVVTCDPDALKHALAEVVSNAIAFAGEHAIHVKQWQDEEKVHLTVSDKGIGMTAEEVEKALEFFTQIKRDVSEQQGIGVGLPLAKRIIEAHHGTLEIQSQSTQGTTVTISLPLASDSFK